MITIKELFLQIIFWSIKWLLEIENFNYLAEKDPFDGENHRLLSRTKRYSSKDDGHIKQMEKLLTNPNITLEQKINLNFG